MKINGQEIPFKLKDRIMWHIFGFIYWLGWLEYYEYGFPEKKWFYKFKSIFK